MNKPLTLLAYHEAGHAVTSTCLGFGVKKVTIVKSGEDTVGHMVPQRYLPKLDGELLTDGRLGRYHDLVVLLLAGTEAVRHKNPRGVKHLHLNNAGSDLPCCLNEKKTPGRK